MTSMRERLVAIIAFGVVRELSASTILAALLSEMENPSEGVVLAGIDAAEAMYRQQHGDGWEWDSAEDERRTKDRLRVAMVASVEAIRQGK